MTDQPPPGPLIQYPKQAAFGRIVPKSKIYQHSRANTRLKDLFVAQVEQITWQYKLAPETVKLPAKPGVPELQIFVLTLKMPDLHEDVLRCIDSTVQYPVIFELHFDGRIQTKACYKRPALNQGEGRASKWVTSDYFASAWLAAHTPRTPMPMALDMAGLYEQLLRGLIPLRARIGEGLTALIERTVQVRSKQREVEQVQARLNREKQFNRKVAINAELRGLRAELAQLQ